MKFKPANKSQPAEHAAAFGVRRLVAAFRAGPACGHSATAFQRFGGIVTAREGRRRQAAGGKREQVPALQKRAQAAFTLAEVLAALLFMAIVIPVAVQGLQVASRAGSVSERKAVGARIAESKLNELVVTGQWQSAAQKGTVREGLQEYPWQVQSEPWSEDGAMRLVTVHVTVPVQGQDYDVHVSTLVDATQ
jgi:type II secretory pathway pseudopilin PulG